jgi:transposase
MARRKEHRVRLRSRERRQLTSLVRKGVGKARMINRARVLMMADERQRGGGKSDAEIAATLGLALGTVAAVRRRYSKEGLQEALTERPRSGQPVKLGAREEAMLTTLACSSPPEGRSRWTLRLLADRMVELKQLDTISHETIRRTLKKTTSSRGNGSSGASGR